MRTLLLSGGILLVATLAWAGTPLKVTLSPRVSTAPARLVVEAFVEPNAENRALRVEADSGNYFRSSEEALDGENAKPTHPVVFADLPAGSYEVTVVLQGTKGVRAVVHRLCTVMAAGGE